MRTFASTLPARFRLALLCAAASTVLATAAPARAEIIDFDPEEDAVPAILDETDRELLASLTGTRFVYLYTQPSPAGEWALAFVGDGIAFLNLAGGDDVMLEGFPPYFNPSNGGWLDDTTYGYIGTEMVPGEDEEDPPTFVQHRVTINATDGSLEDTILDGLSDMSGSILSASPDLETLLIVEPVEETTVLSAPVEVTLGESPFGGPDRDLPDGLPGLVGDSPLGTLELFAESTRIVLTDTSGGDRRVLAELPEETAIGGVAWRPDGARVALMTNTMPDWDGDRGRDNTPPGEGLPNLGSINVQEALGNVAPEDNPLLQDTAARVFDAADGSTVATLANADFPQGLIAGLVFSPGGSRALLVIAQRSDLEGRDHPTYAFPSGVEYHILDPDFAVERTLAGPGLDTLASGVAWVDDDTMVAAVPSALDTHLHRVDLGTGTVTPAWSRPGSIFQIAAGNGRVYFSASTFDQPIELWAADAADVDGSAEPLTDLNAVVAERSALRSATVRWTDDEGRALVGQYVYHEGMRFPPAEPGPVVVWQQGGPGGQMVSDFGTSVESPYSILPHFGIPVFVANAAGRAIDTPQFYSDMAEGSNFGQLDIDQIAAGVEALVERGIADPDRVGITGCSYGGYFTLQSLRAHPDLYAAGNAQCSLSDLFEEFTFGYTPFVSYLMGTSPFADPEEYRLDSPMYGSKDVTAPTLLFHGTEDFLPVPLINNIHDQLEINGTPVTFLRVAGEGHGFGHPSSQAYAAQLQIDFFREHLEIGDFEPPPPVEPEPIYLPLVMSNFTLGGGGEGVGED